MERAAEGSALAEGARAGTVSDGAGSALAGPARGRHSSFGIRPAGKLAGFFVGRPGVCYPCQGFRENGLLMLISSGTLAPSGRISRAPSGLTSQIVQSIGSGSSGAEI